MGATMGICRISTLPILSVHSARSVQERIRLKAFVITLQMLFGQVFAINHAAFSQTSSTGAIVGAVLDISGRALPEAAVEVKAKDLAITRLTRCDSEGHFVFPLLPPGIYLVTAYKDGFSQTQSIAVKVPVTESIQLAITMKVAGVTERVEVQAEASALQTETAALGRVIDTRAIQGLPLVTRNFTHIVDLSAGVLSGVNNAGELGVGSGGLSQIDPSNDGIFVHGLRSYDNSYEFDGVPVTDLQASSIASGGVPIPNPDAIEEFKVQTGLYDASFGEHAGASISLVTKSGTDTHHGSAFEFLRNDVLNANDFFFNRTHKQRPVLKQNQFGLTIGGPFRRNKLFYFGSYQGTRQTNGLASGQARLSCSASIVMPPLTDDRSQQALGGLFAGMTGAFGGTVIKPDGSNINPVALQILNFKLPSGSYLIPTAQAVNRSLPFESQGLSTLSVPCSFDEDQFLANFDVNIPHDSRLSMRWLRSNGEMNVSFPGNGLNGTGNVAGFPSNIHNDFRVLSLSYMRFLKPRLLNEARFGYTRTLGSTSAQAPFQ